MSPSSPTSHSAGTTPSRFTATAAGATGPFPRHRVAVLRGRHPHHARLRGGSARNVPAAAQVAFTAKGEVHGSNEPGERVFAWDKSGDVAALGGRVGGRASQHASSGTWSSTPTGSGRAATSSVFSVRRSFSGRRLARLAWRSCSPGRRPISSGSTSWCCRGPSASSSPPVRRSCSGLACCFRCSSPARP